MPPTTHNKSGSGSCKSGSSAHKASRKKRLDKENAELKRKLAQYEAAEEARKTAKRPTKEPSNLLRTPRFLPTFVLNP
jgi:cell shape-determining protein MreC